MRLVRTALVAAVAAGLLCVGGSIARRVEAKDRAPLLAPQANSPTPTLKVYSRETIVDVAVTDKGNPVHGLKKEDFTVKEDGKPQPIKSFEEFGSQAVQPPPKLPPNIYTNLQPPAPTSAVNVMLLDFTNAAPILALDCCVGPPPDLRAGPGSLNRAMERQIHIKQYAMKYLQGMPAGTRVAVLGASYPGKLRVLQGFTSDPALLSAAVDSMAYDTDGSVEVFPRDMEQTIESYCTQQEGRNRMTLESLDQIAADLVGIKGRKNLLWFTVGIPTITDPADHPPCLTDYNPGLKKAYGLLAAAQVTVYPIYVRGVVPPSPSRYQDPIGEDHQSEWLSMESVAEATGGTAFYNNNDLKAGIAKAIDTGSQYYTLSYVPPGSEYDGRHHTIKLEVDKPGLHLTYRDEYYAEDPAQMAPTPGLALAATLPTAGHTDMRAAMGRAMPTSADILFDVQVKPSDEPAKPSDPPIFGVLDVKYKTKPLTRYGFQYALPGRQIAFATSPNGVRKGSLEFDIAAYDADGKLVNSLSQSINLPITADQAQQLAKGPFRFFQQLDLPPGQIFLRMGVLDRTSNKVGTLEIPVTVPKNPPQRAAAPPTPTQPAASAQPRNP